MLRLSRLTDYAVVALVRLGRASLESNVETTPGIAAAIGIPEPTVAKVLKALTNSGLVISQRGAHGGYRLAKPLSQIPVADVIVAIDGPIALTSCVDGAIGCESQSLCPVAGRWGPGEPRDPGSTDGHHAGGHGSGNHPARIPHAGRLIGGEPARRYLR